MTMDWDVQPKLNAKTVCQQKVVGLKKELKYTQLKNTGQLAVNSK